MPSRVQFTDQDGGASFRSSIGSIPSYLSEDESQSDKDLGEIIDGYIRLSDERTPVNIADEKDENTLYESQQVRLSTLIDSYLEGAPLDTIPDKLTAEHNIYITSRYFLRLIARRGIEATIPQKAVKEKETATLCTGPNEEWAVCALALRTSPSLELCIYGVIDKFSHRILALCLVGDEIDEDYGSTAVRGPLAAFLQAIEEYGGAPARLVCDWRTSPRLLNEALAILRKRTDDTPHVSWECVQQDIPWASDLYELQREDLADIVKNYQCKEARSEAGYHANDWLHVDGARHFWTVVVQQTLELCRQRINKTRIPSRRGSGSLGSMPSGGTPDEFDHYPDEYVKGAKDMLVRVQRTDVARLATEHGTADILIESIDPSNPAEWPALRPSRVWRTIASTFI